MTIIPLEVQTDVSVDSVYDVQILGDEEINTDLGVEVVVNTSEYTAGNGILIWNKVISIDPKLILDCGTSTTVLHGGVT